MHVHPAPFRSKFHRIGQKVNQYLVETHRITVHIFYKYFLDINIKQLIPGLHLRLNDIDYIIHYFPQRHGRFIQRHLAALNFGHIQYVIDQPQQMLTGQGNFAQAVNHPVFIINIPLGNFRHTDNGIHGGTDIMAHAGKKLTLCHIGMYRICHGLVQFPYLLFGQLVIDDKDNRHHQQNRCHRADHHPGTHRIQSGHGIFHIIIGHG